MVYSNDMVFCDECDKYDVQQSLNTTKYNKTVPDYKVSLNCCIIERVFHLQHVNCPYGKRI